MDLESRERLISELKQKLSFENNLNALILIQQ